jgi:hypothetical protein
VTPKSGFHFSDAITRQNQRDVCITSVQNEQMPLQRRVNARIECVLRAVLRRSGRVDPGSDGPWSTTRTIDRSAAADDGAEAEAREAMPRSPQTRRVR